MMLKLPGHTRYSYSPIVNRTDYSWPEGKRLAFYIALNIEHFAFGAGIGMDPSNRTGAQTSRNFAWRDYGNRIGNWRLFEILDELKLPASILLNSLVCDQYPEIIEKIRQRGDDVLGHGRTNAEVQRPMWEYDEARAIQECTETIGKHVGVKPTGWMGPGALESNVTPDLLKEAGYTHLLDWPVDDQPIWMQTRSGPLLSVPYPMELNDAGTLVHRDHTGREFGDMIVDQFEQMLEQSERHPLVFALALHGFIVGQPFRLRPLWQAIKHCVEHKAQGPGVVHSGRGHREILLLAPSRGDSGQSLGQDAPQQPGRESMNAPFAKDRTTAKTHVLRSSPETIHWGYFDGGLEPVLTVDTGDRVSRRERVGQSRVDASRNRPDSRFCPNSRTFISARSGAPATISSRDRSTCAARRSGTCSR